MLLPVWRISHNNRNQLFYWWLHHFEQLLVWATITAEQLAKPLGKIILVKILQKLQSIGNKVRIFSQIVCVLDFLEDMLRVKQSKYERLYWSNYASHWAGTVDQFFHMLYQRFVIILKTRSGGMGLVSPVGDTNVIFDNYWNPQLSTIISPLYMQRRQ